jgi:FkbM family methyltransferase
VKLVGITITINESDIIEASVRYNLRYLDRLIILDIGSIDNTIQIIKRLIAEGLPIELRQITEFVYHHAEILNSMLSELSETANVSHAFLLDSDEILLAPSRDGLRQSLASVAADHCVLAPWVTYCPAQIDNWDEPDPVRRIAHRRQFEVEQYYKIIVSRDHFLDGRLTTGNHHMLGVSGSPVPTVTLDNLRIAHFPVRTENQILSKILMGSWGMQLKPDRKKGDGYHWTKLNQRFRRDLSITHSQLEEIASSYASPKTVPLVHDPLPIPDELVLRYTEMIDQDLTRRLIGFTDMLVRAQLNRKTNPVVTTKAVAVCQGRHGLFSYHINDTVIGKSMEQYGEWKEQDIVLLRQLIKPGSIVVDVGAYIGSHTLPLAQMTRPNGKVHAFEPQRLAFQLLCANIALNSLDNVFTHNTAIADKNGSARVPMITLDKPGDYSRFNSENQTSGETVSIYTLDQLQVSRLDLIKIDVSGMELQVLSGAANNIQKFRPMMFIYCDPVNKPEALLSAVLEMGYRCWWHIAEYYNPGNFFQNPDNIFTGLIQSPAVNILCTPAENTLQIKGIEPVLDKHDTWQAAQQRLNQPKP